MEEPEDILRRELAKEKNAKFKNKFMCKNIVEEFVEIVAARSVVDRVMVAVVDMAYYRIKILKTWEMMENDPDLQDIIKKKMERQARDAAAFKDMVEKDDGLERKRKAKKSWMRTYQESEKNKNMDMIGNMMDLLKIHGGEDNKVDEDMTMDWSEEQEHRYLEDWMVELGIEWGGVGDDMMLEEYSIEMEYLDSILVTRSRDYEYNIVGMNMGVEKDIDLDAADKDDVDYSWMDVDWGGCTEPVDEEDNEVFGMSQVKSNFDIGCEAYNSLGTWFMNNWIMPSMLYEKETVGEING